MIRWEYCCVTVREDDVCVGIEPRGVCEIDEHGERGWEPFAVSRSSEPRIMIMHLKRPLPTEPSGTTDGEKR
jgi:hypothetical protein